MRSLLASNDGEQRRSKSVAAAERLTESEEYRRADAILVFLSLPTEIDTTPVILRAWQVGKRVLAPKVDWEGSPPSSSWNSTTTHVCFLRRWAKSGGAFHEKLSIRCGR